MNQILDIRKEVLGEEEVNSISTRELHEFLEVKRVYSSWIINRLNQLGAVENEDFVKTIYTKTGVNKSEKRGRKNLDYIVTTDIGKHLSMMEKNEKGMQARSYFIAVDKEYIAQLSKPLEVENILGFGERGSTGFIKDKLIPTHYRSDSKSPLAIAEKKLAELYNYRDGLMPEAFKDLIFLHEKIVDQLRKGNDLLKIEKKKKKKK